MADLMSDIRFIDQMCMHKSSACHTISYHIMLYHTIQNKKQSMYIYMYIHRYCDINRNIYENVDIS